MLHVITPPLIAQGVFVVTEQLDGVPLLRVHEPIAKVALTAVV